MKIYTKLYGFIMLHLPFADLNLGQLVFTLAILVLSDNICKMPNLYSNLKKGKQKSFTYSKRRLDCLLKVFLFLLRLLLALMITMNLFIKYSYHLLRYKYSYQLLEISSCEMALFM